MISCVGHGRSRSMRPKLGIFVLLKNFFGFEEPKEIIIHPEQIDLLVKWMFEVRDELQEACDDLQEE